MDSESVMFSAYPAHDDLGSKATAPKIPLSSTSPNSHRIRLNGNSHHGNIASEQDSFRVLTPVPVPLFEVRLVIFSLAFVTSALLHFVTAFSHSSVCIHVCLDWLMGAELNIPQWAHR